MNPNAKLVVQVRDGACTDAGTAFSSSGTTYFDTLGYDYAIVNCISATNAGTMNTLQIMEADVTTSADFTTFAGYAATITGTSPTAGDYLQTLNVNLKGRKRYLKAIFIPSLASTVTIIANLFKGENEPRTAAQAGVSNVHSM